jgi:hypothetical protein
MTILSKDPLQIQSFHRPGTFLGDRALAGLVTDIQTIAADCFDVLPPYQAMTGTRQALSDKLISLARDDYGTPAGFCSMVFHKQKKETASHHRKQYLNRFYSRLMDFDQEDEVLQIGYFHLTSVVNYYLRQMRMKKMLHVENPALETF